MTNQNSLQLLLIPSLPGLWRLTIHPCHPPAAIWIQTPRVLHSLNHPLRPSLPLVLVSFGCVWRTRYTTLTNLNIDVLSYITYSPRRTVSYLQSFFRKAYVLDAFLSRICPDSHLTQPSEYSRGHIPVPSTMWQLRDEYSPLRSDSVWAVFPTHEEVGLFSFRFPFHFTSNLKKNSIGDAVGRVVVINAYFCFRNITCRDIP